MLNLAQRLRNHVPSNQNTVNPAAGRRTGPRQIHPSPTPAGALLPPHQVELGYPGDVVDELAKARLFPLQRVVRVRGRARLAAAREQTVAAPSLRPRRDSREIGQSSPDHLHVLDGGTQEVLIRTFPAVRSRDVTLEPSNDAVPARFHGMQGGETWL